MTAPSERIGNPHRHYARVDSTNERARELASSGAPHGTVVTASEQTAGRGRHGRRWSAPPGTALLYSAIVRPLELYHRLLPLAAPVAVCEACEAVAPARCEIKWPNDVWIAERKVAGVLIEARPPDWAVVGIGVNVSVPQAAFPADLRWPATSLGEDGIEVAAVREALDGALGRWVRAPEAEVLAEFGRRDGLRGRRVGWEEGPGGGGTGVCEGIDERGNLLVRTDHGELATLGSGEVSVGVSGVSA